MEVGYNSRSSIRLPVSDVSMSTPRPKRHLNKRNASHQDLADYDDPAGVVLKPTNLSAGTIYNFPRNPLDIFCPDGSPPSKIDDITGNLTTISSDHPI